MPLDSPIAPRIFPSLRLPSMSLSQRTVAWGVTAAMHVAAVAALLQFEGIRKPLMDSLPIMVELIKPPEMKPPPSEVVPPRPRPVARDQPPVAKAPPSEALPVLVAESPVPAPAVAVPVPKPDSQVQAAAPAPVVAPSFNAAYLQNPPPAYPLMSRRRGEKGTVMLRVYVSAQGEAESVQVRTSSGFPSLDTAALEAVRRWRFVPARQGTQPIAAFVIVPIVFSLEN
jgi:protein TonB